MVTVDKLLQMLQSGEEERKKLIHELSEQEAKEALRFMLYWMNEESRTGESAYRWTEV